MATGIAAWTNQFGVGLSLKKKWGIRRCEDFGEIVFNMVANRLLAKTDTDTRDDFHSGYDFTDALRKPFWPAGKLKAAAKPAVK